MKAVIIALMTVSLLSAARPAWPQATLLDAVGEGDTIDEARQAAIAALSQQIVARVVARTDNVRTVDNQEVDVFAQTSISVVSDIKYSGLGYTEPRRVDDVYVIQALLTPAAYVGTVRALASRLEDDPDGQTFVQLGEYRREVEQLLALLHFARGRGILSDHDEILQKATMRRQQLLVRTGNYGLVEIVPTAALPAADRFEIVINDQPHELRPRLYLPAGRYTFHFAHADYVEVFGRFGLRRRDQETIELAVIEKPPSPRAVRLLLDAPTLSAPERSAVLSAAETTLQAMGVIVSRQSVYSQIRIAAAKGSGIILGNFAFFDISVNILAQGEIDGEVMPLSASLDKTVVQQKRERQQGESRNQFRELTGRAMTVFLSGRNLRSLTAARGRAASGQTAE